MMDKRLDGFAYGDAVLTAVESRSSSPVRISRDENMQSVLKKSAGEIIPASSKKRNLIYKRCIFAA